MEFDRGGDIGQRLCFDASVFFAPATATATCTEKTTSSEPEPVAVAVAAFDVDAFLARHATAAPTLHALHADLRAFDQRLDARCVCGCCEFNLSIEEVNFAGFFSSFSMLSLFT